MNEKPYFKLHLKLTLRGYKTTVYVAGYESKTLKQNTTMITLLRKNLGL